MPPILEPIEKNLRTFQLRVDTVRRQNIWLRLGLRLAEFRPHHGVDIKRRSCGAASVDVG